jgi:hypothetical protein
MKEEWRPTHISDKYEVSNFGQVRNVNIGTIQKPRIDKYGYKELKLYLGNYKRKTIYVHQLVVGAFVDSEYRNKKLVIDHIDNNKLNNNLDNLQLVSHRFNISKSAFNFKNKLTGVSKQCKKYRADINLGGKKLYLGVYETPEKASSIYNEVLNHYENTGEILKII